MKLNRIPPTTFPISSCAFEDFPAAVGDVLVERGGHHGGADVAGAAANQAGLLDLVQTVGVFEVGQIA